MTCAAAGLVLGLAASLLMTRALETMLFEVRPADPPTLMAVAGVLLATAATASIGPARRAMRIDPAQTLRAE